MRLPIMISGTITDASGRTLSGQTAEAFWNSVRHAKPLSVGFNCALGAKQLRPHVEELSRIADVYVSAHPERGPAQRDGRVRRAAARDRRLHPRVGRRAAGSTSPAAAAARRPTHIKAIAETVAAFAPRVVPKIEPKLRLSGLEPLNIGDDSLFVNVGERTNVTGSKAFSRLILAGRLSPRRSRSRASRSRTARR